MASYGYRGTKESLALLCPEDGERKLSVGEEIIFAGEKEREKAEEWKREAGGWRDGREGENTKGVY